MANPILEVKNLKMYFTKTEGFLGTKKLYVKAVDDVSFAINEGETFGLVGESGCGKSTTGRTIIKLYEPTAGEVFFQGKRIAVGKENLRQGFQRVNAGGGMRRMKVKPQSKLETEEQKAVIKTLRKNIQMIFQDPYATLNSRMTVQDIIAEPLKIHKILPKKEQKQRVYELLKMVGLGPEHASRYPHEFSGGQRQRIGIARALAINPKVLICDEPISALDVSIQAQVINLLEELQEKLGLTYLFIAHDLSMVKHISDRIAVMYLGKIVEVAPSDELFENTLHPYTKALLASVPVPDAEAEKKEHNIIEGEIPSAINPPSGCRFRTRCPFAAERCAVEEPKLKEHNEGHTVACHLFD